MGFVMSVLVMNFLLKMEVVWSVVILSMVVVVVQGQMVMFLQVVI